MNCISFHIPSSAVTIDSSPNRQLYLISDARKKAINWISPMRSLTNEFLRLNTPNFPSCDVFVFLLSWRQRLPYRCAISHPLGFYQTPSSASVLLWHFFRFGFDMLLSALHSYQRFLSLGFQSFPLLAISPVRSSSSLIPTRSASIGIPPGAFDVCLLTRGD